MEYLKENQHYKNEITEKHKLGLKGPFEAQYGEVGSHWL